MAKAYIYIYLPFVSGEAENFRTTLSLTRYFDTWSVRYLRARQVAQFAELVTRKGIIARERRAFVYWKLCILVCVCVVCVCMWGYVCVCM